MSNIFKSTIHHLFHGHETYRNPNRINKFRILKQYNKEMWLEDIKKNRDWGSPVDPNHIDNYIDELVLEDMVNTDKPILTICIVSYRRYNILVDTLQHYIDMKTPLNVIVWLNSYKDNTEQQIKNIKILVSCFSNGYVYTCDDNKGTAYPRYMMTDSLSYKPEFNTPYMITTDDDVTFKDKRSLYVACSLLSQDRYKDYGAIGIQCKPRTHTVKKNGGDLTIFPSERGFHEVDALGASTMFMRTSMLKQGSLIDNEYIMGWVDWDTSLTIKFFGYKLGLLYDDNYSATNNHYTDDYIYNKERNNPDVRKRSTERFIEKWGLTPKWRSV